MLIVRTYNSLIIKKHRLQISSFCIDKSQDAYSAKVLILPLMRMGCDEILNSGKTLGVCGCGEHAGCEDCLGVPHGGMDKITFTLSESISKSFILDLEVRFFNQCQNV